MQTLAQYLGGEENKKDVAIRTTVVEKDTVYIGAPTTQKLLSKFNSDSSATIKAIGDTPQSPLFSGITLLNGYYKNSGEIICDGDVLINGTLLLDSPVVKTSNGCRIYATKTIFLQGTLTFVNLANGPNKTNLQLVSSRALILGVGTSHCEDANYTGKYFTEPQTFGSNPLRNRTVNMWTTPGQFTRAAKAEGRTPAQEGETIMADAALIPGGPTDASCFPQRREVPLERLLLNAPQIQSRYRGSFRGIMISELALASLNAFTFEFDPVFKEVPILPFVDKTDVLYIK